MVILTDQMMAMKTRRFFQQSGHVIAIRKILLVVVMAQCLFIVTIGDDKETSN